MTPLLLLLFIALVNSEGTDNSTTCDGFQSNFNMKDVIGEWHLVAVIPNKAFHKKFMVCSKMEISETDEAGLRWLINKSVESPKKVLPKDTNGIIVRQRYHTETPFDVWSRSIEGVNGCFQLVIALDVGQKDIHKALKHDPMMQLHLLKVKGKSEPFLLQILWGRLISVVIFQRKQGVTLEELAPAYDFITNLRGPQIQPQLCESPLRDILI